MDWEAFHALCGTLGKSLSWIHGRFTSIWLIMMQVIPTLLFIIPPSFLNPVCLKLVCPETHVLTAIFDLISWQYIDIWTPQRYLQSHLSYQSWLDLQKFWWLLLQSNQPYHFGIFWYWLSLVYVPKLSLSHLRRTPRHPALESLQLADLGIGSSGVALRGGGWPISIKHWGF